jgi:hypothetical protein
MRFRARLVTWFNQRSGQLWLIAYALITLPLVACKANAGVEPIVVTEEAGVTNPVGAAQTPIQEIVTPEATRFQRDFVLYEPFLPDCLFAHSPLPHVLLDPDN